VWLLVRWAGGGICARFGDLRMSGRCADRRLVRGLLGPRREHSARPKPEHSNTNSHTASRGGWDTITTPPPRNLVGSGRHIAGDDHCCARSIHPSRTALPESKGPKRHDTTRAAGLTGPVPHHRRRAVHGTAPHQGRQTQPAQVGLTCLLPCRHAHGGRLAPHGCRRSCCRIGGCDCGKGPARFRRRSRPRTVKAGSTRRVG
jgi:hypothetical protein